MHPEKHEMTEETSKQWMRISQVAERTGLSRQTIQYYLFLGVIHETARSPGGQRLFDDHVVERVKLIHRLNTSNHYSLRDIRETFLKDK